MIRQAQHPGPAAADNLELIATTGQPVQVILKGGIPLSESVARVMADTDSGWLEFEHAEVQSLTFVAPAAAPTPNTVAWYSSPHRFKAGTQIKRMGMIVGKSGDTSFLHGHGIWSETDGPVCMGHVLADETVLTTDTKATGFSLGDARFHRLPDAQTNFELFRPQPINVDATPLNLSPSNATDGSKLLEEKPYALLRVAPNIDLSEALAQARERLGWSKLRAYGLGSLIDAHFTDAPKLECFETEFLIEKAVSNTSDNTPSEIEISIVGRDCQDPRRGRLAVGKNPILITAEIILQRVDN